MMKIKAPVRRGLSLQNFGELSTPSAMTDGKRAVPKRFDPDNV
jgi:hypothetical protein